MPTPHAGRTYRSRPSVPGGGRACAALRGGSRSSPARNSSGCSRPVTALAREERRVGIYYFYILDRFCPGFIKIGSYAPYSAKVWLNGHEWAKRQATQAGLGFAALSNGFAACDQPERLQAICDTFGPDHIQAFFDRWITSIPTPLTDDDRAAGYWWELSMRPVEVSRTLVLDIPRRARAFFEALVADNIGIGRPEEVSLVFARHLRRPTQHPYQTRIFTSGTEIRIDFRYKHSRVTSKTAARCGSRPSSTSPRTSTSPPVCTTFLS